MKGLRNWEELSLLEENVYSQPTKLTSLLKVLRTVFSYTFTLMCRKQAGNEENFILYPLEIPIPDPTGVKKLTISLPLLLLFLFCVRTC